MVKDSDMVTIVFGVEDIKRWITSMGMARNGISRKSMETLFCDKNDRSL